MVCVTASFGSAFRRPLRLAATCARSGLILTTLLTRRFEPLFDRPPAALVEAARRDDRLVDFDTAFPPI
jgi:hypothetical protein